MRSRWPVWVPPAITLFTVLAATAAAAQEPPRGYEESVEVDLQLIDVVALDQEGNPLRGLSRENFVVEVDGVRRDIVSADAASSLAAPPAAGAPAAPELPAAAEAVPASEQHWVLMLLDFDHISPIARKPTFARALRMIRSEARASDMVAIVALSGGRMKTLHGFTVPALVPDDLFADKKLLKSRSVPYDARVENLRARLGGPGTTTTVQRFIHDNVRETRGTINQLSRLTGAMSALPGRKALVLFSDGLMIEPGKVVRSALDARLTRFGVDPASLPADNAVAEFDALLSAASRGRVSFFAVRTGGHRMSGGFFAGDISEPGLPGAPWFDAWILHEPTRTEGHYLPEPHIPATRPVRSMVHVGAAPSQTAYLQLKSGLATAAARTGGGVMEVTAGRKRFDTALSRLDATYTIAFARRPGDAGRPVTVRLVGDAGRLETAETLPAVDQGRKDLEGRLDVATTAPGIVLARVVLDRPALGPSTDARVLAVYARILDDGGSPLGESYQLVPVPASREPELVLPASFRVAPGRYLVEMRVSAVDDHATATFRAAIDVP